MQAMRIPQALKPLAFAAALLAMAATAQAPADLRVALVIGNSAYPGPAALANPANDARAMSATLRGLGFSVVETRDASKQAMEDAIAQVRDALKGKQGVGMFYYAGHGLQLDWRNYMVPVDARIGTAAEVPQRTVDVGSVIDAFRAAGNRLNIVVLDACRDNPFPGAASGKGLAQLDAPPGTILAYATAPGNVADDGAQGNGLYTQYLLQELVKPQARIEDVFKRVRLNVRKQSAGRQIPWESTSLEDDFYFNTGQQVARPREDDAVRAFNEQKAEWDRIRESTRADDLYTFLQKYPSGPMSELAAARLERLDKAKIQLQADRTGQTQEYAARRFSEGDIWEFAMKDGLTGRSMGSWVNRVLKVDDEGADIMSVRTGMGENTSRQFHDGSAAGDPYGTYDPPYLAMPAGVVQVGRKWASRSVFTDRRTGHKGWVEMDGKVVARETITVPAGTFDTYRVELNFIYQNGLRRKVTLWAGPNDGLSIRLINEGRRPSAAPDILVRELVKRSRA